jgi:hydroxymethylpyrimidine/phosphomethylpyrimidine kinase
MTHVGVHGCTAITAVTAQNSLGVDDIEPLPAEFVGQQIRSVVDDFSVGATKTGMLFSADIIRTVVDHRDDLNDLVVDPVMVAESGDPLLEPEAERALAEDLIPKCDLVTPNWPEAERLIEVLNLEPSDDPADRAEMLASAFDGPAVIVKGGHVDHDDAVDYLVKPDGETRRYSSERIETDHNHGAGCAYSSLIASHLARDVSLEEAIMVAKQTLTEAIRDGYACGDGAGTLNFLAGQDH